jgi:hypothetical protein
VGNDLEGDSVDNAFFRILSLYGVLADEGQLSVPTIVRQRPSIGYLTCTLQYGLHKLFVI